MHFGLFCHCTMLDTRRVELVQLSKSWFHEVASEFFAMNGIDPPHWTLNSCFVASRSVWVHLARIQHYTKLVAKWVELVQLMHKFVPRSHFGFFCNECTGPTPLNPK